ncbi:S8 family peptidase [Psychrobacillus sp. NPDC093200]|uniref:S8 family peptidase n=1 Tax=Psychrobacillus sp. NPDC093200 TaxID=3390656 RepID=UPI003D01F5DE
MSIHHDFSHITLKQKIVGKPKYRGNGNPSPRTNENKDNRIKHGKSIKSKASELSRFWKEKQEERVREQLPQIETGIPILLEIDPTSDISFLKGLGFEVVSEHGNGFVIVSNGDLEFATLIKKTDDFINEVSKRCNTPARIYAFHDDKDRVERICGANLLSIWGAILDDDIYEIDVSISCSGNIFNLEQPPEKENDVNEDEYKRSRKYLNWQKKYFEAYQKWDDLKYEREEQFTEFIEHYGGEIIGSFIDGEPKFFELCDSFSARVRISGKCIKDLVYNFSYIYQAEYVGDLSIGESYEIGAADINEDLEIIPPDEDAPIITVIDSGIQEEHKYLEPAILKEDSKCLVIGKTTVADEISGGGHGTRVAGAILYPHQIPKNGTYKLPCFLRNARVLDENNEFSVRTSIFPPLFIRSIVEDFTIKAEKKTKIYNHSIAEISSCEIKHMSPWASEIDLQTYLNDVLFIQATGNIYEHTIKDFYNEGNNYPTYLFDEKSRISNPAQSMQALTVGSINSESFETLDQISIGGKNEPSAFSRSGAGIWDSIKPDVVEYGGTWVKNKVGDSVDLVLSSEVCVELIRTSPTGPAYSKDAIGTSFAAPKVAYIAAEIQKIFPNASSLLYRALIAHSASWPIALNETFNSNETILRHIGYGLPDVTRATTNDEYRITLLTEEDNIIYGNEAHIYTIPIPSEILDIGEEYDIRIDVTLSYSAKPRNTRRKTSRYMSTWLDWRCSKIGEQIDAFEKRIFETGSSVEDDGNFKWEIGEQSNHGQAKEFSRSYSTLQKDWTTIKSNQLTDSFCIAVRGHNGWDGNIPAKYNLVVGFEAINRDVQIYSLIRNEIEIDDVLVEVEV